MSELALQLSLLFLESAVAAAVLLSLFSVRRIIGFASVYTTVGVFYYLATLLAGTAFVKVAPGLLMSPGSVALFPACLFAVLLVYIREDAKEARNMIYGLLAANVAASLLGLIVVQHWSSPLAFNPLSLPRELFVQSPRLFVVGTFTLFADTILIILAYEAISRSVRPLLVRVWLSLAVVLIFDTFVFVTGGFMEHPAYGEILLSGMVGKMAAAVVYAVALTLYLQRVKISEGVHPGLGDLFQVLTYRQKYEALRAQATKDALTGVHNRAFLDEMLTAHADAAQRTAVVFSIMIVDVDHFKRINDSYGHPEGDRVLRVVAQALAGSVRASDVVCRYGGEEFCLILPVTPISSAARLAQRICEEVPEACARAAVAGRSRVTVTIGLAAYPGDGERVEELVRTADQRLYAGKRAGRDRFVAA